MSDRFIVAAGNWDASNTAIWSASSGGAAGASVPTSSDNVFFDANSGAVTVTASSSPICANLDFTGFTGTFAGSAGLQIWGSLTLDAGMTRTYTGTINFLGAGSFTITTNGKTLTGAMTFNNGSGTWTFQDAISITNGTYTVTTGTLDTNGQTVTGGTFNASGSTARTVTLGASTINVQQWNCATITNLTFDAGTSTISVSNSGTFSGGGLTYNDVNLPTAITMNISGANTFANLTRVPIGTGATATLQLAADQIVTGTLTITSFNDVSRIYVSSNAQGTQKTITAAALSLQGVDFEDIVGAGAASWDLSAITNGSGDCGGNTDITFTTPTTLYWSSGTGNYSDPTKWFLATGGGGGAGRTPLPQDTARFDANSFTAGSQTITQDMYRMGSVDFTGTTNSPTFTMALTTAVYGSITVIAAMTLGSSAAWSLKGRGSNTITSNSNAFDKDFTVICVTGSYTLQDAFATGSARLLTVATGTFDANNFNVTTGRLSIAGASTRTVTMGSGTWSVTGNAANVLSCGVTGLTLNADTSTVDLTYSGGTGTRTITGTTNAKALNILKISAGTDTVTFNTSSLAMAELDFTGFAGTWAGAAAINLSGSYTLSSGMTVTHTGLLTLNGTSGSHTITTSGKTLTANLTMNGAGGTWTLQDSLTMNNALTLNITAGTFDSNDFTVTISLFSSTGTGVRVVDRGASTWNIFGSGTTIWTTATQTNATFTNGTSVVNLTYSGGTSSRLVTTGNTNSLGNFAVTAGTDSIHFTGTNERFDDLDFTGFAGTWLGTVTTTMFGSLTITAAMTMTYSGPITFSNTTSETITSNGNTFASPITMNGVSGTLTLQDALATTHASGIVVTDGTFDANEQAITTPVFYGTGSNTRAVDITNSTITLTGTTLAWYFATTTNLTFTSTGSTIKMTNNSGTTKQFSGGDLTYNDLWFAPDTGAGAFNMIGSNTFSDIKDDGSVAHSFLFTAGTTTTFETMTGFSGYVVTLGSITAANHNLVKTGGGSIGLNLANVSRSQATPDTGTFYAGASATDGGNNTGWIFEDAPTDGTLLNGLIFFGVGQ